MPRATQSAGRESGNGRRTRSAPRGLRATTFELDNDVFAVLSYPVESARIPALSRAESEVLRAAIGGLSNAEIAAMRRRSIYTIQNQLSAACRKLNVSSRSEAAALLGKLEADK